MNKIKMLVVGIIMNCAGTEKSFLSWLSYYVSFGISADHPLVLDLGILQLTFGLNFGLYTAQIFTLAPMVP